MSFINQDPQNPRVQSVLDLLESEGIACTFEVFPSGAAMIDVVHAGRYICIQVTDTYYGYSEITEEDPGFSTVPSFSFSEEEKFRKGLLRFLGLQSGHHFSRWDFRFWKKN